ncbi:MAG: prolipoprotein diacylglyceryl transferase family protein [Mycobacteriales bacterium]
MLDQGLLLSIATVVGVAWLAARWVPPLVPSVAQGGAWSPGDTIDVLLGAAMAGVLAGRVAAVLLDDPESLRSLSAFLIIRGGVEMWPGAVVAALVAGVSLHRRSAPVLGGFAALSPVVLVAYAGFEATCLVREGCYGPSSALGLRPDGLATTMVPSGVIVAIVLVLVAAHIARHPSQPDLMRVALAVTAVAASRSISSIWLPRIGDHPTRQHLGSIMVAVLGSVALLLSRARSRPSAAP